MAESPYIRIHRAEPEERKKIYEEIYSRYLGEGEPPPDGMPISKPRRRKRISIYRRIVGSGHDAILEIGCGTGDLTCELGDLAARVVGVDISEGSLDAARRRVLESGASGSFEFLRMNAIELRFSDCSFDYAISTSMIEHLHPEDVNTHLKEVARVLKPGGQYMVWCPNRLGHHADRPFHFCMMSHRELADRMRAAGFRSFRSPIFQRPPMVNARFKMLMEDALTALHLRILWSHLGVRSILMVGAK